MNHSHNMHMYALGTTPITLNEPEILLKIDGLVQSIKYAKSRKDMDAAFDKMKQSLDLNTPEYDALFQKNLAEIELISTQTDAEGIRAKNVMAVIQAFSNALRESNIISEADANAIHQKRAGTRPESLKETIKELFDYTANKNGLPQEENSTPVSDPRQDPIPKETDKTWINTKNALIAGGSLLAIGSLVYLATRYKTVKSSNATEI